MTNRQVAPAPHGHHYGKNGNRPFKAFSKSEAEYGLKPLQEGGPTGLVGGNFHGFTFEATQPGTAPNGAVHETSR